VYRVRVSEGYGESQMGCRDWAARMLERVRTQWSPTRARARAEDGGGGFAGRMLAVLVVMSSSLPWSSRCRCRCRASAQPNTVTESQSHTHMHAHREKRRRKTNDAASDACEESRPGTGNAGGLPRLSRNCACMNAMACPLRRSNHGDSSFSNYSNRPVGAARLTPSRQARSTLSIPLLKPRCLPVGQQQRRHSTGERRCASSLRPGCQLAYMCTQLGPATRSSKAREWLLGRVLGLCELCADR
jgi:hypothetical protein